MDIFNVLNSNLRRMSHIKRYSSMPVHRSENIAEHTFYCTLYSHLIAEDLKAQGVQVDPAETVFKSMYHDFEEPMSGDIIRSFKYSTPQLKAAIDEAAEMKLDDLLVEFGSAAPAIKELWLNAKNASIEGAIVKFADLLCAAAYCREEYRMGNRYLMVVVNEMWNHLIHYRDHPLFGQYWHQLYPNEVPMDLVREVPALERV